MNRARFGKVLLVGVAIFALGLCAKPASAWWGCRGCCGGWYGCHGCGWGWGGCGWRSCGYWGGCGYGCGYGWGGYGCGCGWGGCGYGSCYDGSCCGTSVAYPGYVYDTWSGGQYIVQSAGTTPATFLSNGTPGAAPRNRTSIESPDGESALLTVLVPNEAKVTINGLLTKSTGSERRFASYGLRPGYTYKYKVKAEVVRDGKIVPEEQTVSLTAGATQPRFRL